MKTPSALFFDFDGVILESLEIKTQAFARLFADHPEHVKTIVKHHVDNAGVSRYEKFRHYYENLFHEPLSDDEMARLDRRFSELIEDGMLAAGFVPGAFELLDAWSARIPCFVLSAAPQGEVERTVRDRGLERYFRSIHGSPVPKAEHLGRLLGGYGLAPSKCLFVGDGQADWEAARAHGVPFIQRLTPHSRSPFSPGIPTIEDLRNVAALWERPDGIAVRLVRARRLLPFARPREGTWAYCGRDILLLRRWQGRLGSYWRRIELSRQIDTAAESLRRPYLAWLETFHEAYGNDPDWWATRTAERNSFASPFFLDLCLASLVRDMISQNRLPDLLVCESAGLMRLAERMLVESGVRVRAERLAPVVERLARPVFLMGASVLHLARAAWRRRGAYLSLKGPPSFPRPSGPRALVAEFVHEESFRIDRRLKDRYFPGLLSRLGDAGYEVWVLPNAHGLRRSYAEAVSWMRVSQDHFIIPEDWLQISDYLAALRGSWRALNLPRQAPPLGGIDVEPLLEEERWAQALSAACFQARLYFRLMPRLSNAGFIPRAVLSWFENQPYEKALALGVKRVFPEAEHIGILSYLQIPNYMTPFPTPAELRAGALPHRVICCGRKQAELVRLTGTALPVEVGGALRYRYLWEDEGVESVSPEPVALVPLPSRLGESLELVETVRRVMTLDTGIRRWLAKPHPDYAVEELRKALGPGGWPEDLGLHEGGMPEALRQSAVVLSTGSGAMVEAACRGVPVIVVGRITDLNYNLLAWTPELGTVSYSPEEIAARIRRVLRQSPQELTALRELGRRVRRECFEPVTEASWPAYLPRPSPAGRARTPIRTEPQTC